MNDAERMLREARVIAVVGLSTDPAKPSHEIPRQMQKAGYRVIPVHPTAREILGEPAYRTLSDIAEVIDVVNVFRPADEVAGVVRDAIACGARGIWVQLGIASAQAAALAHGAGLAYVEDSCIGVERRRLGVSAPAA